MLDGLLYHESCLVIDEHYTDTGGFSDHVFEVIAAFAEGRLGADHRVGVIESLTL